MNRLRIPITILLALVIMAGVVAYAAEKPSSVIHVVTLRLKEGTTPAQVKEVGDALEQAAKTFPGLTRLWLRPIKIQGGPIGACAECKPVNHIIVMEFASEAALKQYAGSETQKAFYKVYMPIREESRTHDITN